MTFKTNEREKSIFLIPLRLRRGRRARNGLKVACSTTRFELAALAIFAAAVVFGSSTAALSRDQSPVSIPYHPREDSLSSGIGNNCNSTTITSHSPSLSRPNQSASSNSNLNTKPQSSESRTSFPNASGGSAGNASGKAPLNVISNPAARSGNIVESEASEGALPAIVRMQNADEEEDTRNAAKRSGELEPDIGMARIHTTNNNEPFMMEETGKRHAAPAYLEEGQDPISRADRSQYTSPQQFTGNRRRVPGFNLNNQNINFNNDNFKGFNNNFNSFSSQGFTNVSNSNNTNNFDRFNNRAKNAIEKRDPLAATFDTSYRPPDRFADNAQADAEGVRHFANGKHFDLSKISLDQAIEMTNASRLDPNQQKQLQQRNLLSNGTSQFSAPAFGSDNQGSIRANIPYHPRQRPFDDSPRQIRPHHNRRELMIQTYAYPDF